MATLLLIIFIFIIKYKYQWHPYCFIFIINNDQQMAVDIEHPWQMAGWGQTKIMQIRGQRHIEWRWWITFEIFSEYSHLLRLSETSNSISILQKQEINQNWHPKDAFQRISWSARGAVELSWRKMPIENIFFKLYSQCLHKAPMENLVKIGCGNSKWVVLQSSSCHLPTSVTPQGSQDCPRPPEAQMKAQCSWLVVLLCYCYCYFMLLSSAW